VTGTSRDAGSSDFHNLKARGLRERVRLVSMNLTDFRSVLQILTQAQPDEIYNLAGQSSVSLSFEQPIDTFDSVAVAALNLLEAIRFMARPIRLYNACSSECFGDTGDTPASEDTPFRPNSPYATARAAAYWSVANYRDAYGLHACSGILFNHESPLRPARFVTQKVVSAARRIAGGSKERLTLGTLAIVRDWGWAPEYVDAMWRMLQQDKARDYVIATGEAHSLEEFVAEVFRALGLDWRAHVDTDKSLGRPTDPHAVRGDPRRAEKELGWRAQTRMPALVQKLIKP
jgi:GDPmannose 4,6-dehydratase